VPESDPGGRILAWAQAMREWALANPEGFRLIYGDPVPGYHPPEDGPGKDAELRACTGLVGLVAAAWPTTRTLQRDDRQYDWADFATIRSRSTSAWAMSAWRSSHAAWLAMVDFPTPTGPVITSTGTGAVMV
jgi:hypothetical protein